MRSPVVITASLSVAVISAAAYIALSRAPARPAGSDVVFRVRCAIAPGERISTRCIEALALPPALRKSAAFAPYLHVDPRVAPTARAIATGEMVRRDHFAGARPPVPRDRAVVTVELDPDRAPPGLAPTAVVAIVPSDGGPAITAEVLEVDGKTWIERDRRPTSITIAVDDRQALAFGGVREKVGIALAAWAGDAAGSAP